jgi:hypothetical protein
LIGYKPESSEKVAASAAGDLASRRIVVVSGYHLKPTCQKFREAYYRAVNAGLAR